VRLQIANARLLWEQAPLRAMRDRLDTLTHCRGLNTPDETAELHAIRGLLRSRARCGPTDWRAA
jgi:hypothetical protein